MTNPTPTTTQPRPYLTTAAYYLAFIGLGLTVAMSGPTLPFLARHTASQLDQISLIFVAGSFGYLLGSLLGGRAYDRYPGHRILSVMLLAIAATSALVPIIPRLWLLAVVLFLVGMSQGALDVGCNTLLIWVHGKKVGPFMNGLHFFFGVGTFISPLIIARVISARGDVHWAYWLFALFLLPIAAWFWRLPSPAMRMEQSADEPVRKVPVLPIVLFVLFFTLYVGSEVGFGNWIYTYAVKLNLSSETAAAYLTSAFWGSFTLGRLLGIGISTRVKPKTILSVDLCGCLAALAVLIAWPASSTALWAGVILLGLSMASIFATTLAFAEEHMHLTGTITGWFLVGSGAGGMILPWVIGQFFQRRGPQSVMVIVLIDVILNLALLVVLITRRRNSKVLTETVNP